jgi:hypothetical protein
MPRLGWLTRPSLPCGLGHRRYDDPVAGPEPGERADPQRPSNTRRLAQPPSERYAPRPETRTGSGSVLPGPLARSLVIAVGGVAALVAVAAIGGSTVGLLFISGVLGAGVGLVLARAAVPRNDARPMSRRRVTWLAIALAIGAVAVADVAIWVYARGEGGTLTLPDYLLTTFGPFVPGEAIVAALAAAWGANAGPVQG